MLPMLAIQIIEQNSYAISSNGFMNFISRPIDVIFFDVLLWFGWIPIAITVLWGIGQIWLDERSGKFEAGLKYVILAIDVPALTEQTPKALENLFSTLYAAKSVVTFKEKWLVGKLQPVFSFEIVSDQGYIQFIIRCQTKFRDIMEAGIYAQYPDAEILEVEDYATKVSSQFPSDRFDMWGAEFTLDKPSHFPIRTYVDFEDQMTGEIKDPLGYTLEQLSKMSPGEHFWFQMLIQPCSHDWRKVGVAHVNKLFGVEEIHTKGLFATSAELALKFPIEAIIHATTVDLSGFFGMTSTKTEADPWKAFKLSPVQQEEGKAILRKTVKVAHGAKIRIIYCAEKPVFKKGERATMVKGILNQYTHLNLNSFKMHRPSIPRDDYFWQLPSYPKKQTALMKAYQSRSWGIGADPVFLNAEELATIWHFPTINIKAPLIKKAEARRAEPPVGLPVTFLENTLPGAEEGFVHSAELPIEMSEEKPEFNDGIPFEPLSEALPHVIAPTERMEHEDEEEHRFMPDPVKKDSDEPFAPPDLPV
jgi:hypothetical protein